MRRRLRRSTPCWQPFAAQLGFTRTKRQREQILRAAAAMSWSAMTNPPPYRDAVAAGAVINAVIGPRRADVVQVGVAQVGPDRQLFGLLDGHGTRRYVLERGAEAIYVLADRSTPQAHSRAG